MNPLTSAKSAIGILAIALVLTYRTTASSPEDIPMTMDAQMRAAEEAQRKDPAWKPALEQITQIQVGKNRNPGSVHNYCLNTDGNILACCGGKTEHGTEPAEIRVFSPEGKQVATWPLEETPQAICVAGKGEIFVAGGGRIIELDQKGKVVASAASPVANEPVVLGEAVEEMLKEMSRMNNGAKFDINAQRKQMKEQLEARRANVTGIAVTERDVFVC